MYPGERVKVSHGGPLHTENLGPGMETDCVIADPKLRGEQGRRSRHWAFLLPPLVFFFRKGLADST